MAESSGEEAEGLGLAAQDVLYAGVTPFLAGLYQINIRVAPGIGAGDVPIGVRVGSASTPPGALRSMHACAGSYSPSVRRRV